MNFRNGEYWAEIRKPAQQKITRPVTVARYFPVVAEISDEFVAKLRKMGTVEDMRTEFMAFALESTQVEAV